MRRRLIGERRKPMLREEGEQNLLRLRVEIGTIRIRDGRVLRRTEGMMVWVLSLRVVKNIKQNNMSFKLRSNEGVPQDVWWPSKEVKRSEGLCDTIEKITTFTGIKAVVDTISKITGKDCGCAENKVILNQMFPYKNEE